ncbi:MAG: GNAT family N-acetyltransferase [bacterium]|jgi:ribosomal protein S18 acetylase RimI-like enzyme
MTTPLQPPGPPSPRAWLTLVIASAPPARAAGPAPFRALEPADAGPLATLMLDGYRGTVDDEGEGPAEARNVVDHLFAGGFGEPDWAASQVAAEGDRLVAATVITRDRVAPHPLQPGEAFVAFIVTAAAHKRSGLGRQGLERSIAVLRSRGERRLHLVVTRANTPAVTLFGDMGFVPGPLGDGP